MARILPSSPNWYCNAIIDATDDGVVAYGARSDVNILLLTNTSTSATAPVKKQQTVHPNETSTDEKTGDANDPSSSVDDMNNGNRNWENDFNSCVLLCTLSRLHKEKMTSVRLVKHGEPVSHGEHHNYSLFTGSDDGKVRHYKLTRSSDNTMKSQLSAEYELPRNCKVTCIEICGEDTMAIGDDKSNVTCWNWTTGITHVSKLVNISVPVYTMALNKTKGLLAVGLKNGGIFIYDISTYQVITKLKGHDEEIHSIRWKPDQVSSHNITGDLVSTSKDRTIRLWDISSRRCLLTAKLPSNTGSGYRNKSNDRERLWLSSVWLPTGHIVSSSRSGDLLVWDFSRDRPKWVTLSTDGQKGHSRIVFTLTEFCGGTKLISTSMDRNVVLWDIKAEQLSSAGSAEKEVVNKKDKADRSEIELEEHLPAGDEDGLWKRSETPSGGDNSAAKPRTCTGSIRFNMSTLGGFSYCVRSSPVDPGQLAVAVGDNLIRLWNVNEGAGAYNISNLWQGLKSKVSTISWHPLNEGQLAYGTDDGRVGVFPSLSKKPPIICGTYHQKMVYVISWGPPVLSEDAATSQNMTLYSVGDGTVLIHNVSKAASEPALDLNTLLREANGSNLPVKIRSEIAWSADYSLMYLGNDDGSVFVLRRSDLRLVCSIKVSNKLVNAVRLSPKSCKDKLVAVGSNENAVKIVDTSAINPNSADGDIEKPAAVITDAMMILKGHKSRITDMCWSPHEPYKLVTVSYDSRAIVWDVRSGVILSDYRQQHGKLLTCIWSQLDADLVYTGSDDFSLHSWRPSLHLKTSNAATLSTAKTATTNTKSGTSVSGNGVPDNSVVALSHGDGIDISEMNRLLEEKKKALLAAGGDVSAIETSPQKSEQKTSIAGISPLSVTETSPVTGTATILAAAKSKPVTKPKKKATKSHFPNMFRAGKQSSQADVDDLLYLNTQLTDKQPVVGERIDKEHLGIFSIGNQQDFKSFIDKEKDTLLKNDQIEQMAFLSLCEGDVETVLQTAASRNCLTDSLINSASMLGHSVWVKYCRLYAQQLRNEGLIHQAVTYLLYTHDIDTAILWLMEDNLYREAICIARSRLPAGSERITEIYSSWAKQLRRDANLLVATKCFVALKDPTSALNLMTRKSDIESMGNAIRFGISSTECREDLMTLCDKLTRQCLLDRQYDTIEDLCKPNKLLHPFFAWSLISQSISPFLDTGETTLFTCGGLIGHIRSVLLHNGVELTDCRKQCSLSQQNMTKAQTAVAVCERILNICVDIEEGKICEDKNIVDVFTMIMSAQQEPLSEPFNRLTSRILLLLSVPGCDVMKRLGECSFEPSHSLSDYSLYICYLWASLTHSPGSSIQNQAATPQSSALTSNNTPVESEVSGIERHLPETDISSTEGQSADTNTSGIEGHLVVADMTALISLVSTNMYKLAFSLCNGLFLPWLDSDLMKSFLSHLQTLENEVKNGAESLPKLDIMEALSGIDLTKAGCESDVQANKCVLAMLLDMMRHLFIYMCGHDDSGHLPNLTPGRQLIREWVVLHATCHEVGVTEDLHVSKKAAE